MKKNYEFANIEVLNFPDFDIVTTSNNNGDNEVDAGGSW